MQLTRNICCIPIRPPNIFVELHQQAYGIGTPSLLAQYAIALAEQLSQILNDPGPLGDIYQDLVKYIFTHYGGAEYIPNLIHPAYRHSPLPTHCISLNKNLIFILTS